MTERKYIYQMEPWFDDKERNAVDDYMKGGGWLTEFQKTKEFEGMIADYVGAKYCSVLSNGTVSLFVALKALGIGKGDEVVVPDYTMIASANAVVLSGATPIFVDIDDETLCLDFALVKKAITDKTKAVMLVTINGRFPDMEKFVELCDSSNLHLIEDAAQSLGSKYKEKHLGTFGKIGSFSFSAPKIITTGQGGALITDDKETYEKMLKIKDFGRVKSGVDEYESLGYNFKFTDLQAVIGIEQVRKLDRRVKRKKEMYKLYKELLNDINGIDFIYTDLENTSPWFIDILVDKEKRDNLITFLKEKEIGVRPFYPALHTQVPYSSVTGDFKNSEKVSEQGIWLPSSSFLKDSDIAYVCDAIKEFFKQ